MSVGQSIEPVRLVCVECAAAAPSDAQGWQAHLTCDEPPEVGIFCPTCARAEFD